MGLTAYQAHMKRELKGKMAGKTAAQRKAIFKAAAASYKKKPSTRSKLSKVVARAKASRASHTKPKSTGGNHNTSKGGFNTGKIFKFLRIGALLLPAASEAFSAHTTADKITIITRDYFGYDRTTRKFSWSSLGNGWIPFIAATVVTTAVPKIGAFLRSLLK